ncbi:MAG: protein kinase [Chloroflexi bacterium]|nr:protein kinase [Chloroflexota bacterium]
MAIGKVLVIEDQPTWQKQIRRALKGYELRTTPNIREAEQLMDQAMVEDAPFQVVTLDINLRGNESDTSGEELMSYIKEYHPYIRCVVVSGTAGVDQVSDYFSVFGILKCFSKSNFDARRFREFIDGLFHLGAYRLLKEVGRGAMGVVYQAEDTQSGAKVAVKVLSTPDSLQTVEKTRWLDRFKQEAKTVAGPTLDEILKKEGRLAVEQVIQIGVQLFDALAYAHQQKTIHRDIKPSNLIFAGEGYLKVTDFGIAKVLDNSQKLTLTQEVLGTFGYMPPEQLNSSRQVDHRADIYAAGVVLYEALTGVLPFNSFDFRLVPPKTFTDYALNLPADLENIILQSLAADPNARPQEAATVHSILRHL